MSENDLPPEVIADILEVLGWIKTHPNGKREDMGELFDVYKKWRAIIFEQKVAHIRRTSERVTFDKASS